jgi:hypothetical protein
MSEKGQAARHPRLDGDDPLLLGIVISHPHLDRYGLLGDVSTAR